MHKRGITHWYFVGGLLFFTLAISLMPLVLVKGFKNYTLNNQETTALVKDNQTLTQNNSAGNQPLIAQVSPEETKAPDTNVQPSQPTQAVENSPADAFTIKPNIASAASNAHAPAGLPVELTIPKINVHAPIEHIGLDGQGNVGVPQGNVDVSWFDAGPRPGEQGSALISGHYGIWKNNNHSVFDLLDTLKAGDAIYVTDDQGVTRTFIVQTTKVYSKDQKVPELFNRNDGSYLNIITCHGQWLANQKTYSQRFVVFAALAN